MLLSFFVSFRGYGDRQNPLSERVHVMGYACARITELIKSCLLICLDNCCSSRCAAVIGSSRALDEPPDHLGGYHHHAINKVGYIACFVLSSTSLFA